MTTFGPFANPLKGKAGLKFEIGFPDSTPPTIERVWGSGTTLSMIFSEPMIPATSLSAGNYTITQEGGGEVAVESAAFDPDNGSVTLTTQGSAEAGHDIHHHHPQPHGPCQPSACGDEGIPAHLGR